jgi:hypothetical protein
MIISSKKNISFSKKLTLTDDIERIEIPLKNYTTQIQQGVQYYLELDEDILEYIVSPTQFFLKSFLNPVNIDFYIKYSNQEYLCIIEHSQNKLDSVIKEILEKQCIINDLQLIVLSEESIKFKIDNSKFLIKYKIPNPNFDYRELHIILSLLRCKGKTSIKNVLDFTSKLEDSRGLKLYTIWCGIANYFISYDKNSKLTMDSLIWL